VMSVFKLSVSKKMIGSRHPITFQVAFQGRYVRASVVRPLTPEEYADIERVDKAASKMKRYIKKQLPPDVELFYDPNQDKDHLVIRNTPPSAGSNLTERESPIFKMCESQSRVLENRVRLSKGYGDTEHQWVSDLKKSFRQAIDHALNLNALWPSFQQLQAEKYEMQQSLPSNVQVDFNSILVHLGLNEVRTLVQAIKKTDSRYRLDLPSGIKLVLKAHPHSKGLYCSVEMDPQDTLWEKMKDLGVLGLEQRFTPVKVGRLKALWNTVRRKDPIETPEGLGMFLFSAAYKAQRAKQAHSKLAPVFKKLGELQKKYPDRFKIACSERDLLRGLALKGNDWDMLAIHYFQKSLDVLDEQLFRKPDAAYQIHHHDGGGEYDELGHYKRRDDGLRLSFSNRKLLEEIGSTFIINQRGQQSPYSLLDQNLRETSYPDFVQLEDDFKAGVGRQKRFQQALERNESLRNAFEEQFSSRANMRLSPVNFFHGADLNEVANCTERYNKLLQDFQEPLKQICAKVQSHFPHISRIDRFLEVTLDGSSSICILIFINTLNYFSVYKRPDEPLESFLTRLNSELDERIKNRQQNHATTGNNAASGKKVYADPGFEV
jgi:hypothetical protein